MSDPFEPGLLTRLTQPPRKMALLRASRIGDFICATPALRALRQALPGAEIVMITLPLLHGLVERSPHLDRFVAFPGFPGIAEQFFDAGRAVRVFAAMQAERFDLAIQMQGSGVHSNPFTLLLGARATAGFIRPNDAPGRLDAALAYPEEGHEVRRVLALTSFLGAPARGEAPEIPLWPEDHARAQALLAGAAPPLLAVHPAARDRTRRWPAERFAEVARELHRRHGGSIVLLGDEQERAMCEALVGILGRAALNLAGRTTVETLGAVIARVDLLVTNDSGPAHLAYALGTPTVTIFGGADPDAYGPPVSGPFRVLAHPVPCRPRGGVTCPSCAYGYACLEGITVQQVVAAAESLLPAEPLRGVPREDLGWRGSGAAAG